MSPRLFRTKLNSVQMPARLALINTNQCQRRLLGTCRCFFILPNLIVNRSKTLRAILVFSILAVVFTLYLHERMEHQLILDGLTWTELAASNRCLRYSTREYSALLRGVPNDEDGVQWCNVKKITIHRIDFKKPAHCTINVDKSVRKPLFPDIGLTYLYSGDHQNLRSLDRRVE